MNLLLNNMIVSIKNSSQGNFRDVTIHNKKILSHVLAVLEEGGYIRGYKQDNNKITILLKYFKGYGVIQEFKSISRPSRRIYASVTTLIKQRSKRGHFIISTSKGIMLDTKAISLNLGGEVLCKIN